MVDFEVQSIITRTGVVDFEVQSIITCTGVVDFDWQQGETNWCSTGSRVRPIGV